MRAPIILLGQLILSATVACAMDLSVASYGSIQEALDKNPGKVIHVPSGDYPIKEAIRIKTVGGGLIGPGRIIQSNSAQAIIIVEKADEAQVNGLTLTRPEGAMDTGSDGILVMESSNVSIENVRVFDNRTVSSSITFRRSNDGRISRCHVRNYARIGVDDRTSNKELGGYAFRCINGTGISVAYCSGTLIEGNRIEETVYRPTEENKNKYNLGQIVKKNAEKPALVSKQLWDSGYTDNWNQGSALVVNAPEVTAQTRIIGNHIQNAAQGIDLHCDRVIVSNNIVDNAFIGMKAMHGSRNVLIIGNQFHRNDLWAIGLMPGAASHATNTDGGSIIANNIISDFGHGDAHWLWGKERSPIKFETGQLADDPPLERVIVSANVIDCIGEPRYRFAVIIPGGPKEPKGLQFANNLLHPGTGGVCNKELPHSP